MNFTNFTRGQADLGGATSLGFSQGIIDGIMLRRQMDIQDKEMKLKEKHENDWAKMNEDKMILSNLKASIDQQKAESQAALAEEKLRAARDERDFATQILPVMMQYGQTGQLDESKLPPSSPSTKATYGFANYLRQTKQGNERNKIAERNATTAEQRADVYASESPARTQNLIATARSKDTPEGKLEKQITLENVKQGNKKELKKVELDNQKILDDYKTSNKKVLETAKASLKGNKAGEQKMPSDKQIETMMTDDTPLDVANLWGSRFGIRVTEKIEERLILPDKKVRVFEPINTKPSGNLPQGFKVIN